MLHSGAASARSASSALIGRLCVVQSLEQQQQKLSELMEMCRQKDDVIHRLQAAMDSTVEDATRDVNTHFILHT